MSSVTLSLTKRQSFYETVFVNLFSQMKKGRLEVQRYDGRDFYFGEGNEVKANIRITNSSFFTKCALYGDIGFAESYIDGDWHTDSISNVITWFILNLNSNPVLTGKGLSKYSSNFFKFINKIYHTTRENTISGSKKNITEHYDLGNDFYHLFLDKTMTYSSAIFRSPESSLEEAQAEKYDRLCRSLKLQSTDHLLEIGSGWGGMALHAAKNYGCKVTTVTISEEQFKYAKSLFEKEGLTNRVEILLQDYRMITGRYDKIVSIEMLEAVGHKYLPVFFSKCNELLKENGSLALQVITSQDKRYAEFRKDVDFIQKHIFPGSQTPSLAAIHAAVNKVSDFGLFDMKDIGLHYARTLRLWFDSFNEKLAEVKKLGMDDRFIRKWNYYLQYCEAIFKERHISVVQLIYTRPNNMTI
ncbi:cyclopropane-fatty-acyl-phospholipid synthase [Cytophagales bacterium WSM2-2]|nr:cyclopropane-fatty-acyl-phospholipid synthase [Cytophagales bacterium WSM2-2]